MFNLGPNKAALPQATSAVSISRCHSEYLGGFYLNGGDIAKFFNGINLDEGLRRTLASETKDKALVPNVAMLGFKNVPHAAQAALQGKLSVRTSDGLESEYLAQMESAMAADRAAGVGLPEDLGIPFEATLRGRIEDLISKGFVGYQVLSPLEFSQRMWGELGES